jgi:hypothetical protein
VIKYLLLQKYSQKYWLSAFVFQDIFRKNLGFHESFHNNMCETGANALLHLEMTVVFVKM